MRPIILLLWFTVALAIPHPREVHAAQIYTDVTSQMGIDVPGLGSGTAWSDLDADGDQDLLVSDSDIPNSHVYLYRNDGTIFTNVFASSGLASEARNFAIGDFDNDGLEDVAMISFGYVTTKLFRNLGGMRFQNVSASAGIFGTYSWRCAWIDYDDDGFLDLYLCGSTSYLFHNRGDGTFEERAAAAGIQIGGNSCAWLDYDNDGREDCYVGRDGANRLYHNRGDGTFAEVGAAAGVNDPNDTSGVCAGDFDGDGFLDLYSVNIGSPRNTLYHNLGNSTFVDITLAAGVGDVGDGRTATFLDLDYDGLIDIFSSNHVHDNRLYRNDGDGTFTDIAPALRITDPMDPFGTGFADFDNDGDLDVFLATHFGNRLLRCDGMTNHWIQIRLVGTDSNRSAIGTVVRCEAAGRTTYSRVDGGHGMGDTDSPIVAFGLGDATGPIEIGILWPSGLEEVYRNLTADRRVLLVEGGSANAPSPARPPAGLSILAMTPNPATETCSVRYRAGGARGEPVRIAVFDSAGRLVLAETVAAGCDAAAWSLPIHRLAAGIHFIRISAGRMSAAGRITVLR